MTSSSEPSERFELALLADRDTNKPVALSDLLGRAERGEAMPNVRLDDATLLFESAGHNWMPLHWVLGDVAELGVQFEAAGERLGRDEIAIVRSAVDDRPVVDYFLFEPDSPEVVVSIFHPPTELRYVYPTAGALRRALRIRRCASLRATRARARRRPRVRHPRRTHLPRRPRAFARA
jgi:hypothetical protein